MRGGGLIQVGDRTLAGLAWTMFMLALAAVAGTALLIVGHRGVCGADWQAPSAVAVERCALLLETGDLPAVGFRLAILFAGGLFAGIGALVAARRRSNVVGWLMLALGAVLVGGMASNTYVIVAGIAAPGSLPGEIAASWLSDVLLGNSWFFGLFAVLFLLAPEGRPASSRWRLVVVLATVTTACLGLVAAVRPGPMVTGRWLDNPLAWEWGWPVLAVVEPGLLLGLVGLLLVSLASPLLRLRKARGVARQQLRWIVAACVFVALVLAAGPALWALDSSWATTLWAAGFTVALSMLPVAVGIAVLRHHLYGIDVVVNRALVYASLAGLVLVVYVVAVVVVGGIVQAGASNSTLPLLATAVAALVFHPARVRVQRLANRLLYGHRHDPYAVLVELGQRLNDAAEPSAALDDAAKTIAVTLRVPFVAIDFPVGDGWRRAAVHGSETTAVLDVPLTHQGAHVGRLLLGHRDGEEAPILGTAALDSLARQVASAVHGLRLAADLQRSREQLVLAREEERRRLRRDLHDGVGPALAGIAMGLQAARNRPAASPHQRDAVLQRLVEQTEAAMHDVRRAVNGLRPPVLDQLGLGKALRQHAATLFPSHGNGATRVHFTLEDPVTALPAALEVAAYRIGVEALTNVARHARARECWVGLRLADAMEVEVCDDGVGAPPGGAGRVGLLSMRERATELGGTCVVEPRAGGGTRVLARLPLSGGDA